MSIDPAAFRQGLFSAGKEKKRWNGNQKNTIMQVVA